VATGMPGKQRHSKCSEWQPSALIHVASRNTSVSIAPPVVACTRRSTYGYAEALNNSKCKQLSHTVQQLLFVFFWGNANNLKYMNTNVEKCFFCISQGRVSKLTSDRRGGQICKMFSRFKRPKLLKSVNFDRVIQTIRRWPFYDMVYIML